MRMALPKRAAAAPTIGELLAASNGAEIAIPPGVYRERLVLDRPVVLTAAEGAGTVRVVCDRGTALTVCADATVRGLAFESGDGALPVVYVEAGSPRFHSCRFGGARVESAGESAPVFADCRFHGAVLAGFYATGSSRPRLDGCVFTGIDGHAVVAGEQSRLTVARAEITGPRGAGVRVIGSAQAELIECQVADSRDAALAVAERAGVRARSCGFRGSRSEGVRVDGSSTKPAPSPGPSPQLSALLPGVAKTMGSVVVLADKSVSGVTLVDCEISGSATEGAVVGGGQLRCERVRIVESGRSGLLIGGQAQVEAVDCVVLGAGATGVVVRGAARLRGRRLTVGRTGANGMLAAEDAVVLLKAGDFADSGLTALHLAGRAQVTGTGVRIGRTPGHGVCVRDHAMVELVGCEIQGCGQDGIRVADSGDAYLRDCSVTRARFGFALATRHHPQLEACTAAQAEISGILVGPGCRPLLSGCIVRDAKCDGLFLDRGSGARVERCRIEGSGRAGVALASGARPRVRATVVVGSGAHGLYVRTGGAGLFEDCDISAGALSSVYQEEGATTVLEACRRHEDGEALTSLSATVQVAGPVSRPTAPLATRPVVVGAAAHAPPGPVDS
jgi:nitrous oxidase accessory protein NosD